MKHNFRPQICARSNLILAENTKKVEMKGYQRLYKEAQNRQRQKSTQQLEVQRQQVTRPATASTAALHHKNHSRSRSARKSQAVIVTPQKQLKEQFTNFLDRQKDCENRKMENIHHMGQVYSPSKDCTFEPQINETSHLLVQMQQQLADMGLDVGKSAKKSMYPENSFVPKINHTSRLLAQDRNSKYELMKPSQKKELKKT